MHTSYGGIIRIRFKGSTDTPSSQPTDVSTPDIDFSLGFDKDYITYIAKSQQ